MTESDSGSPDTTPRVKTGPEARTVRPARAGAAGTRTAPVAAAPRARKDRRSLAHTGGPERELCKWIHWDTQIPLGGLIA